MSTVNPYASPREYSDSELAPLAADEAMGLWRHGRLLVVHRDARFPARCVKTNLRATRVIERRFTNTWVLSLPLSEKAARRWSMWESGKWLLLVCGFLAVVCCLASFALLRLDARSPQLAFRLVLLASLWVVVFVAGGCGLAGWARSMDYIRLKWGRGDYVWLSGVHPAFLADLPRWPPTFASRPRS